MEAQPFPDIYSTRVTQISGAVSDVQPPAVHHLHITYRKTPLQSKRRLTDGICTSGDKQTQAVQGALNILSTALCRIRTISRARYQFTVMKTRHLRQRNL
jgi:hypothetical protein